MRYDVGRFRRPMRRSTEGQLMSLISLGDGSTLSLDFTTGVLDPRLTFSRDGGGTYIGNDGRVYGVDFATSSSLAIGTGSKSVTLTATANVDRRYLIGQTVWISNGANNMRGPVTAYDASTQVLTINATATSGSGSFTSWTVGNASARFDHDPTTLAPRGLLIEGQAVNIMFRSQAINTSPWFNAGTMTVSETGAGSPANDATSNVVTWTNGTGAGGAWLQQNVAVSAGSLVVGNAYTWSVWLKSRGGRRVNVFAVLQGASGNREMRVDFGVSPPTVTSTVATGWTSIQTPTIVEYPNGWYKVTTGGTLPSGATSVNFGFSNADAVPASGTNGFEAWGYQLEAGSGASSYIPTGASQGTRNADECSMTGTNFSSWFNATEGAFLAHARRMRTTDVGRIASANDNTANESIDIGASTTGQFIVTDGGSALATITPGTVTANTAFKIAGAFKLNDVQAALGGTLGTADTGVTMPTVNQLMIGRQAGASPVYLNGTVSLIKFWPTRLPDSQLQSLTT